MKKLIISGVIGVMLFTVIGAFAGTVLADDNYNFQSDLQVGASGPDVTALQNWLISNGYDIPAISSGRTPRGYFGDFDYRDPFISIHLCAARLSGKLILSELQA